MSPERIAPERFGFKNSRPTVSSDCYALGMVIYETISGNFPYHKYTDLAVFMKVVEGERPPRGMKFTKILWEMLERCWVPEPDNRPSIEDVLQCLGMASNLSEPPSPGVGGGMDADGDDRDSETSTSGGDSLDFFDIENYVPLLSTEARVSLKEGPARGQEVDRMDWSRDPPPPRTARHESVTRSTYMQGSIPPDAWVPVSDGDGIHLPSPHEWSPHIAYPAALPPQLPTPGSPTPPPHRPLRSQPLGVRPPASDPRHSDRDSTGSYHHRRRSSSPQRPTVMSQMDILGPPDRGHESALSSIMEERSSVMASPNNTPSIRVSFIFGVALVPLNSY